MEFSWKNLEEALKKYKEAVLITVVSKRGSAPRGEGTMMLVYPDGKIDGTIGGGPVENELVRISKDLIEKKQSKTMKVSFTGESVICGGNVLLSLEYFSDKDLEFFKILTENLSKGIKQVLVKDLENFSLYLFELENPRRFYSLERYGFESKIVDKLKHMVEEEIKDKFFVAEIEGKSFFFQVVEPSPEIHIFGAGHIAVPLYKMAKLCEFKVIIYDDREEFARKDRFPEADRVVCCPMEKVEEKIDFHRGCFFVLVTREHKFDEIILRQLLGKSYAYIGMIGSRRRVKSVKKRLILQGFQKEEVEKIYSPIGIDIGAETPAEIAVSIIAEIIKVKNSGF